MVVNLAVLLANHQPAVMRDIAAVVESVKDVNDTALVKVILETRTLTDEQIILGCHAAAEARARLPSKPRPAFIRQAARRSST